MTGEPSASRRAVWAALAGLLALASAHPVVAGPQGLRDGLFRKSPGVGRPAPMPPVARYVAEDGSAFILDRTQRRPLIRFDDSPEVWVLTTQPAPRGDVIYKNDMGEPVLRATRLGGVTLFTDRRPGGAAVSLAGEGAPLRLPLINPNALFQRLAQSSFRASRAARRTIVFDAEATPASSSLIYDASLVVSLAIVRLAQRSEGQWQLYRVQKVSLVEGPRPSASMAGSTLRVTVTPSLGLAGRPSSELIAMVVRTGR
jgi:hypothetical protein